MSFRISFILLVLVAVVGGYVLIFELQRQPVEEPAPPFFYDVQPEAIARVSITYQGEPQVFVRKDGAWLFEASGNPVDMVRWSGMTLLLSGPRAARVLRSEFDNPAEYGLDPPETSISLALEGGQPIAILVGNKTPDEVSSYAQVVGFPQLLLVSSSWSDVINRLVTEPPVVTPTPEATETEPPVVTPTPEGAVETVQ
ncbi:MAG: hypothetical protein V1724_03230 [Chloroflexota bacterium]